MKIDCSIIIPVWLKNNDLLDLTLASIESIKKTEGLNSKEIIVVDNGSPIASDVMQGLADLYIRRQDNAGYPWAVNQGIKLSSGPLICVSNNDIRVSPNWYKVAEDILYGEELNLASCHFRMINYDELFSYGSEVYYWGKERWCSSSFFVIKKEVIDKVGLYDENFSYFGYEDWDFWTRVRQEGFKTAYTNRACYQHRDSSTANLLDQEERAKAVRKNREYFKKKHGEYAEILFEKKYPEQMRENWRPFP